jgi:hypothetical protein
VSADLPFGTGLPEDTGLLEDAGILHDAGLGNGNGPVEPGLRALLGLLNSGPTPEELLGENAALEMFRNGRRQADFAPEPGVSTPSSVRAHLRRSRWLAAAGTVLAAAALTTAAYTQALPTPLQNVAYHVLGFVGVPQANHVPRAPGNTHPLRHARSHATSQAAGVTPKAGPSAPPPSPQPKHGKAVVASPPASLSVAVVRHRIVAGHRDVLIARLTRQGNAVQGARLYLLERTAARHAWHVAADATTGPNGRVFVTVSGLTTNAAFRFRGPHGTLSRVVRVIVVPGVSVTIAQDPHKASETVTAGSPWAVPGDVVILQIRIDGHWLTVQVRELYVDNQVKFVVEIKGERRAYRVVLLGTKAHGRSVSRPIMVKPPLTCHRAQRGATSRVCNARPHARRRSETIVSARPVP